jgi:hypothetical protein
MCDQEIAHELSIGMSARRRSAKLIASSCFERCFRVIRIDLDGREISLFRFPFTTAI